MTILAGGIEMGGTKCVVAIGTGPDDLRDIQRIETTTPEETLHQCVEHLLAAQARHGIISAIGVGSFGPAGVNPDSGNFGFITTTPKLAWKNTDVLSHLRNHFNVPMGFDTDVNVAALAECKWGAARGSRSVLYLTVGTGIGGGFLWDGKLLHGLLHPEMGHIRLDRPAEDNLFKGICHWHADCLEGLASGPAIARRWGAPPESLSHDHPAWNLEAQYIAQACANFICTLSPEKIIIGGGVVNEHLLVKIRKRTRELLAGYIQHPCITEHIDSYIVLPGLGKRSGVLGALAIGLEALGCP